MKSHPPTPLSPFRLYYHRIVLSSVLIVLIVLSAVVHHHQSQQREQAATLVNKLINDSVLLNEPSDLLYHPAQAPLLVTSSVFQPSTPSPIPSPAFTSTSPSPSTAANPNPPSSSLPDTSALPSSLSNSPPSSLTTNSTLPLSSNNPALLSSTPLPSSSSLPEPTSLPPSQTSTAVTPTISPPPSLNPWQTAQAALSDYLNQDPGTLWSISVHDVKTGASLLNAGSPSSYTAASTTKLLTAVAFLQKVEAGSASLDQQMGAFPADFQLEQLVNQSDNDSWALLNSFIGKNALEDLAHSQGAPSYNYDTNTINPAEMGQFLVKLYQGQLLNPTHTKLLLSYMQNTEEERFLPSGIHPPLTLFHKVGLLEDLVHDVGIIDDNQNPLTVSIYSNGQGTQDYDLRALKYAQISSIILKK